MMHIGCGIHPAVQANMGFPGPHGSFQCFVHHNNMAEPIVLSYQCDYLPAVNHLDRGCSQQCGAKIASKKSIRYFRWDYADKISYYLLHYW